MSNYPQQNDENRIARIIEMLNHVDKIEFETEVGKEFGATIKAGLSDVIKPYGRECILRIRKLNINS